MIDAGRIVLAADTLGAAQTMLDRAVAYSKQRVQFGRADRFVPGRQAHVRRDGGRAGAVPCHAVVCRLRVRRDRATKRG